MKIGTVNLKNNLFLAPMAGYSDVGFRKICREFGCALTYTEMVSAKALAFHSNKTKSLLATTEIEQPKAVQIFGHEPAVMAEVCAHPALKEFDIIDINMGCPAPKIVDNGDGAALLKDIDLAQKVLESCVAATKKPITVKFRLGWSKDQSLEFAKMIDSCGASAMALHARTKEQMYSGIAFYQAIGRVKENVSIPVIANGDIRDLESLKTAQKITHADGFMIGRGALGSPWIFATLLGNKPKVDRLKIIYEHMDTLLQFYDEHFVVTSMRKHLEKYLFDRELTSEKKLELMTCNSLDKVKEMLKDIIKE